MISKCEWCGRSFNPDDGYWSVPTLGWVCCQKCYYDACNANGVNPQTGELPRTRTSGFNTNGASWKFVGNKMELTLGEFTCRDPWTTGKLRIMAYHSATSTKLDYSNMTCLGGTSLDPLRKGNQYNKFTYIIDLKGMVPANRYVIITLEEERDGQWFSSVWWQADKPGQINWTWKKKVV